MYLSFSDPPPNFTVDLHPVAQPGKATKDRVVRLEIPAAKLQRWLAQGLVGASELHCLDSDSQACVRALCLENVRDALSSRGLDDVCARCRTCVTSEKQSDDLRLPDTVLQMCESTRSP